MRGAEGVVHIGIVTLDEALGEARVVSRLAGIEPEVLQQFHAGDQWIITSHVRAIAVEGSMAAAPC